jgi:hypothetical protein
MPRSSDRAASVAVGDTEGTAEDGMGLEVVIGATVILDAM